MAVAALALLLGAAAASAQPALSVSIAEREFTAAAQDYASMHRRLETVIGPIEVNADVLRIDRSISALASAIRLARRGATAGDFFTLALAAELRTNIALALADHGLTARDVLWAEAADGVDPALADLWVNGPFPWVFSTAMVPCVLEALPPLPPELQYRIVGDTLVLVDVHASLVVDLLPSALVTETER